MNKLLFRALLLLMVAVAATSCVTKKKYMELDDVHRKCEEENAVLKRHNIDLTTRNNELTARQNFLEFSNRQLISDTAAYGINYRDLKAQYDRLNSSYDDLNKLMQESSKTQTAELQKLLAELQKVQGDLQVQEDRIRKAEKDLLYGQKSLDSLTFELTKEQERLKELQGILDKKDSVVRALKNKVLEALTGFVDKGLSVEMKNGKVYVRMDEKLLFSSGSFEVATTGVDALKKLAKVLETNPDINITVEGHTDNVPYKTSSSPINDNWDLSVMRATAVVKILLKNSSIDPARIVAAGRSQYIPVDKTNTSDARSKNRRTEIILTPKLDELLKILESN
jgi:chemotaxis protein MotB